MIPSMSIDGWSVVCLLAFWALGKPLRTHIPVRRKVTINRSISKKGNR